MHLVDSSIENCSPVEAGERGQVLFVDNHGPLRNVVARALNLHGYGVRVANDGLTALALLEADPPDLVLTALRLRGIDGCQLVREIRIRGHQMPIIIHTGALYPCDLPNEVFAEVAAILRKPYTTEELFAVLDCISAASSAPQHTGAWQTQQVADPRPSAALLVTGP